VLAAMGGAMGGSRGEVDAYLRGFERFAFLWQRDAASEYDEFIAGAPTLEACALACAPLQITGLTHLQAHCFTIPGACTSSPP
jgi:hypothetical protein